MQSARGGGGGSLVRSGPRQTITVRDAGALADTFGGQVAGIAPAAQITVQARLGSVNSQASVVGTWPASETVRNSPVETGAYFTQADLDGRKRVAVIGRQVLIPLSTYLQRFSRTNWASGEPTVNNVCLLATGAGDLKQLQADVTELLSVRHEQTDPENLDCQVQNQADSLASLNAITTTLPLLVGAIAGISLLVGGIGIMNIMLLSVTERTREIGVRKALGARPRDILTQFLVEASLLSVGGGIIGMVLGVGLAYAGRALNITPVFSPPR